MIDWLRRSRPPLALMRRRHRRILDALPFDVAEPVSPLTSLALGDLRDRDDAELVLRELIERRLRQRRLGKLLDEHARGHLIRKLADIADANASGLDIGPERAHLHSVSDELRALAPTDRHGSFNSYRDLGALVPIISLMQFADLIAATTRSSRPMNTAPPRNGRNVSARDHATQQLASETRGGAA